jgi:hypothetical protein
MFAKLRNLWIFPDVNAGFCSVAAVATDFLFGFPEPDRLAIGIPFSPAFLADRVRPFAHVFLLYFTEEKIRLDFP